MGTSFTVLPASFCALAADSRPPHSNKAADSTKVFIPVISLEFIDSDAAKVNRYTDKPDTKITVLFSFFSESLCTNSLGSDEKNSVTTPYNAKKSVTL